MEEEDETQSLQSPGDSLSPAAPSSPPILPTSDVTVASVTKPPLSSQSPSLALVVHTPSVTGGGGISGNRNGRSGGGGRDDCWSEEATKVLIDAWGDRFSEPGKGTLKQQQWKEVAEIVNDSRQCKYPKTDIQCKNRIDTVKKKYKQEKAKIASGDGPSKWVFFKKLETLIGGGGNNSTIAATSKSSDKAPMGVLMNSRSSQYRRQAKGTQVLQQGDLKRSSDSMRWHFRKRSASETESESDPEPEPSPDSAESLPPSQPLQPLSFQLPKRLKMDKSGGSGVGDVAKAILGFTEAYEKAETAKFKLMLELEKERMKFAKEMELQRMQFLKTQMEITLNNQEEEEERSKRGERRVLDGDEDDDDDRNVKNNGDMAFLHKLWDDTVAGPAPESGLRKLRKDDSLSTVQSPVSSDQVTRSIIVTKGNNNVRGLRKLKMDPGRAPDSSTGTSSNPGTPLTPGTPCDHIGPFSADKIPSAGEADAASLTTYEWIVINALDR